MKEKLKEYGIGLTKEEEAFNDDALANLLFQRMVLPRKKEEIRGEIISNGMIKLEDEEGAPFYFYQIVAEKEGQLKLIEMECYPGIYLTEWYAFIRPEDILKVAKDENNCYEEDNIRSRENIIFYFEKDWDSEEIML